MDNLWKYICLQRQYYTHPAKPAAVEHDPAAQQIGHRTQSFFGLAIYVTSPRVQRVRPGGNQGHCSLSPSSQPTSNLAWFGATSRK